MFILENVKGFTTINNGRELKEVLNALKNITSTSNPPPPPQPEEQKQARINRTLTSANKT